MSEKQSVVARNSVQAWLLACRPKTLSGALLPVAVATALAYYDGVLNVRAAVLCALFATLMQVAANFINDLFDFLKGTDGAERLGPERACAQGWISPKAMRAGIGVVLVLAGATGLGLLAFGGWELLWVGGACVIFAFLYTTMLSYCGMGDVLVLIFFGFVPVLGTYYVQAGHLTGVAWLLGGAVGLVTDTLLVLNNFRDRDTDRAAGKRTLVVVLGSRGGAILYGVVGLAGCLLAVSSGLFGCRPLLWLPLFYLIPHVSTWHTMVGISRGRALNRVLGMTSRNMLFFGLLIVISLCL
ncbi:MAG: 1,4-dihydroxy-2-naphthoate octaprenyltransferase [Alloprevotella sp.]|nr:1,4-dihydroxy-2-naphthoate octaprenyltransferase [Alloprevotella sp.]